MAGIRGGNKEAGMIKRLWLIAFVVLLAVGCIFAQNDIPGQKSMLMIDGKFFYQQGAWADYALLDKAENKSYRMKIAILEPEKVKGKPFRWLEIEVAMEGDPAVVTRILAEELPSGPGRIEKVVVQVEGYSAFRVPKKYFKDDDAEVGRFDAARIVRRMENKVITIDGRSLSAWEVEAESAEGEVMIATVSDELPPIALIGAETEDIKMTVNGWGGDAVTMITGKPKSFFFWILDQIGKEIKK